MLSTQLTAFCTPARRIVLLAYLLVGTTACGPALVSNLDEDPFQNVLQASTANTRTVVATDGAESTNVVLDGSATVRGLDTDTEFLWRIDDRIVADGEIAQVELRPGTYNVSLEVTNAAGLVSVDDLDLTVVADQAGDVYLNIDVLGLGTTGPTPGFSFFTSGTTVRLDAIPAPGQRFVQWNGDVQSNRASTIIVIQNDLQVTAVFAPLDREIVPLFFLPFAQGMAQLVSQGNNGEFSHAGRMAWDFPMRTGTPVLAVDSGQVVEVEDSANTTTDSLDDVIGTANYIILDHGAGLQSLYAHLDVEGAYVVPGQEVVRGQVLARSGNTGFSSGPHLHYEVLDVDNLSRPSGFFEVAGNEGVPVENDTVVSSNNLIVDSAASYVPSPMPADAFVVNDIILTPPFPPAHFLETGSEYLLAGEVQNNTTRICAALVDPISFETVFCELMDIDNNRTFAINLRLPPELEGEYFFGIISGDGGAFGDAPRRVTVLPPVEDADRPVARIARPVDTTIEYFEEIPLDGSLSSAPFNATLEFQWMQSSGPPAVIANTRAARTAFHVEPGEGTERVAFQLVVDNGTLHSYPDEVVFNMPDVFHVSRFGVDDQVCLEADLCRESMIPLPAISFATQVVQGWTEVVNLRKGDKLELIITDPDGLAVRGGELDVESKPPEFSFWRVAWSTTGLQLKPGDWTLSLRHNNMTRRELPFRVVP